MNTARSTLTVITLAAATTLALGACAASKPQDPAASQSAATSSPTPSPTTTDTVPTVPGYRPGEIPPVPLFSVPSMDVFASNADKLVFIDMERADVTAAAGSQGGVAGLVVSYGDAGQVFLAGVTALAAKDLAFG